VETIDIEAMKQSVKQYISENAYALMQEQMQAYISLFKVEVETLNSELMANTRKRGYDFETIPEQLINSIKIEPVIQDGDKLTIRATFDQKLVDQCSDTLIDFINDYAIGNTNLRYLRYGG